MLHAPEDRTSIIDSAGSRSALVSSPGTITTLRLPSPVPCLRTGAVGIDCVPGTVVLVHNMNKCQVHTFLTSTHGTSVWRASRPQEKALPLSNEVGTAWDPKPLSSPGIEQRFLGCLPRSLVANSVGYC